MPRRYKKRSPEFQKQVGDAAESSDDLVLHAAGPEPPQKNNGTNLAEVNKETTPTPRRHSARYLLIRAFLSPLVARSLPSLRYVCIIFSNYLTAQKLSPTLESQ